MKFVALLVLGVIILFSSFGNLRGNMSTIQPYMRRRVSAADAPKYAKTMGLGTLIIGTSIIITALLQLLFDSEALFYISLFGILAGVALMLYAQFKYNKGLF